MPDVFAVNIHLNKTYSQGPCFSSFHNKSTGNVVALNNHTGDGLMPTALWNI